MSWSARRWRLPARARRHSSALPETLQAAFVGVAQQLGSAVVNIGIGASAQGRAGRLHLSPATIRSSRTSSSSSSATDTPGQRPEFRQPSLGSGVIIDKRGLVLTNFHVIKGADEISVRLSDKKEYRAAR